MIESAMEHGVTLFFRQPLARNRVRFRFFAASGDLAGCEMVWWKRSAPAWRVVTRLSLRRDDGIRAEWTCEILFPEEAHYIKYFFRATDRSGASLCLCERGCSPREPEDGFWELLQVSESDLPAVPAWAQGCTYYQIFPERFAMGDASLHPAPLPPWDALPTRENFLGGDLRGIRDHLPYLRDLNVDCLYLNPVFAADFNHKYATADYYRVDPAFGRNEDLRALTKEAHGMGIRVVLDGVFNHVGVHFPPFADLMEKGEDSRYRAWFYPKRFPIEIDPACYECVGDYPYMPRLRVACPEVRDYVCGVLRYWMDYAGVDGWRLDVADELDAAAVRAFRQAVKADRPDALLLAETWGDASRLVCEGDQFDCAMNYLFRDAVIDYFARRRIDEAAFGHRLERLLMKYPDAVNLAMYNCLGSHDTARFLTECGGDKRFLRLATAFQMTFAGSPALYYGDEIGMAGDNDPLCRGGMRWDDMDRPLLCDVRRLTALRRAHPSLRRGDYRLVLADPVRHVFAFERRGGGERALVAFNLGQEPRQVDFADAGRKVDVLPLSVEIVIDEKEVFP